MANEVLKQAFQEVHSKVVSSIDPDPVMDVLFSKKIISSDQLGRLRQVQFPPDRCRDLLTLLHSSSHPQTFIYLRLSLLQEQSWLVDDIDKLLTSPTSQLQQLPLDHPTNGINSSYEFMNQLVVNNVSRRIQSEHNSYHSSSSPQKLHNIFVTAYQILIKFQLRHLCEKSISNIQRFDYRGHRGRIRGYLTFCYRNFSSTNNRNS